MIPFFAHIFCIPLLHYTFTIVTSILISPLIVVQLSFPLQFFKSLLP